MFAIYKALTAVKLAEEATAAGVDAVPVFWLATYDHDLAEVNHVSLPGPDGALQVLTTTSHNVPGAPVSAVRFGDEIVPVVEEAVKVTWRFRGCAILRETYRPGETLGTAFARFYARVFAEWGVILLDASDANSTASRNQSIVLPLSAPVSWLLRFWRAAKRSKPLAITSK